MKVSDAFPSAVVTLNLQPTSTNDEMFLPHVILYRRTLLRDIGYWAFIIFTAGIGFFCMHWFLSIYVFISFSKCSRLRDAANVMIIADKSKPRHLAKLFSIEVPEKEINLATGQTCSYVFDNGVQSDGQNMVTTYLFTDGAARYLYHHVIKEFCYVQFDYESNVETVLNNFSRGIDSEAMLHARRTIYGPGCIIAPLPPLYELLVKEVVQPIYVYQAFALTVWFCDEYYSYASAILFITIVSLADEIYRLRQNAKRFRVLAREDKCQRILVPDESAESLRTYLQLSEDSCDSTPKCHKYVETHTVIKKSSEDIVPGDLIEISYGKLPCDMLLLVGSVLMNESMLSGESIPKAKTPLESFTPSYFIGSKTPTHHYQALKYMLYGGTDVVQIKCKDTSRPVGLVIRTAFTTVRGQMLSTLFDPKSLEDKRVIKETYTFLGILAIVAFFGAIASIWMTMSYNLQTSVVIIRFFDTFTNLIAPILPASMAVGCTAALNRLKKIRQVLCLQPTSVLIAGEVNTLVFDKTGTLTEDDVTIDSFLVCSSIPRHTVVANQEEAVNCDSEKAHTYQNSDQLEKEKGDRAPRIRKIPILSFPVEHYFTAAVRCAEDLPPFFLDAVSCCHSLVYWKDALIGDLLEIQLFNYTSSKLIEHLHPQPIPDQPTFFSQIEIHSHKTSQIIYVLKKFEFKAECQRMSVLIYHQEKKKFFSICKGSPEQLSLRCEAASMPKDYTKILHKHTEIGKRVIAYGFKEISQCQIPSICCEDGREIIESCLKFMGFALLINQLKPDSIDVIQSLHEAGVHCKMATGDNAMTALAIARKCHFIEPNKNQLLFLGILQSECTGKDNALTLRSETSTGMTTHGSSSSESEIQYETSSLMLTWRRIIFNSEDSSDHVNVAISKQDTNFKHRNLMMSPGTNDNMTKSSSVVSKPRTHQTKAHFASQDYLCASKNQDSTNADTSNTMPSTPVPTQDYSTSRSKMLENDENLHNLRGPSSPNNAEADFITQPNDLLDNNMSLTTQKLVDLINSDFHSNVGIALTGPAFQYISAMNTPATYNILCKLTSPNQSSSLTFENNKARKSSCAFFKSILQHGSEDTSNAEPKNGNDAHMPFSEYCLRTCRVFARMTPEDKAFLIKQMRQLRGSPLIGMCGDGTNDCEALKTANVGVSLSGEVTSICAHITAMTKSIKSTYDVLCEGRGALVNGFSSCKYIILYAAIQFTSVMILYSYGGNLTDQEYMFVDIFIVLPLVVSAAWTHSADKLTRRMPLHRLTGPSIAIDIFGQFCIQFLFMLLSLYLVTKMAFYKRFEPSQEAHRMDSDDLKCYENTTIFLMTVWQYITVNLLVQKGSPWRQKRTTNIWYILSILLACLFAILIFFSQELIPSLQSWLGLMDLPPPFRFLLLGFCFLNYIVSHLYEKLLVERITCWEIKKNESLFIIDHPKNLQRTV